MIDILLRLLSSLFGSWAAEVGALTWLGLALVAAVLEISLPHFGCMFISAGAVAAAVAAYFGYGSLASAYEAVDRHVYDRAMCFLCRRHKVQGRSQRRFPREHLYGELGVLRLRRGRSVLPSKVVQ